MRTVTPQEPFFERKLGRKEREKKKKKGEGEKGKKGKKSFFVRFVCISLLVFSFFNLSLVI
jgi:hypothetical protein